jgi:hypothetical protein
MPRTRLPEPKTATQTQGRRAAATASEPTPRRESHRDFIEQIVVAFILAFLVRGFEAEAFVIPTGSMAPTLMGAHKDMTCPQCGFSFTVNASDEFDQPGAGMRDLVAIQSGLCGNCRAPVRLDEAPSFNGDRILVMKFLFNLPWTAAKPFDRWDVMVFHYPEEPEVNYIKRLVGMPDEDLRIHFGDILTRPRGSDAPFRLQRKPLRHQDAMQMNVWDDRHRPRALDAMPEWRRWQPSNDGAWTEREPGRFTTSAREDWNALRYRHLLPDPAQWEAILTGKPLPYGPSPRLISDFYAYNAGSPRARQLVEPIAPHWVGDLTLSARVESRSDTGQIRFELVKSGVANRCEIDLATGRARILHGASPLVESVVTPLKGRGTHAVKFANVDGRLTLWVDGRTPFGEGAVYQEGDDYQPPTAADLDPVGIAVRGAEVHVSDLVLTRDIHYTLYPGSWDYDGLGLARSTTLSDPREFPLLKDVGHADFTIEPGRTMMLGDNSPRSKDGRGWSDHDAKWDPDGRQRWEVPEDLLIGKAFFVYWPHGKPFWPDIAITRNLHVPFRPNFERMLWIR